MIDGLDLGLVQVDLIGLLGDFIDRHKTSPFAWD
jgi:hypothetical protein